MDFNDKIDCSGKIEKNTSFFVKKHKIFLEKKNKYDTMTLSFSKKLLNIDKKEYELELTKQIKKFLITMSNKCTNFNPNLFIHNLKKTNFNIQKLEQENKGGRVLIDKINTFRINSFDVIEHELMHLATIKKDVYNCFGFNDYLEGYTELLTQRYFENYKSLDYPLQAIFARNIESMLGKDYMEKKFFEGNLLDTVKELYKYSNEKKIKHMFYNLNRINYEFLNYNKSFNEKIVQEYWNEIYEILIECLKNKCKELNSIEEIENVISKGLWTGSLGFKFVGNNEFNNIYHLSEDKFNEYKEELYSSVTKTK